MGILADLFVSTDVQANDYSESQLGERKSHLERYAPVEFRNLTDIEFSTLYAILKNEEWLYERHGLELVKRMNDDEAWLFKFPSSYIEGLAKLKSTQIVHLAMQWSATEEMEDWKISDTALTLSAMVNCAKQAVSKNKHLYLWGSV